MGRRGVGSFINEINYHYEQLERALEKRGFVWGLVECYKLNIYDTTVGRYITTVDVYLSKENPDCDHLWTTIYKYALHNPTYPKENSVFYFEYTAPNAIRYMIIVPTDIIEDIDNEIDMQGAGTLSGYVRSYGGSVFNVTKQYNAKTSSSMGIARISESDPLYEDIIKLMNIYC